MIELLHEVFSGGLLSPTGIAICGGLNWCGYTW
jgi:hypothetical protein